MADPASHLALRAAPGPRPVVQASVVDLVTREVRRAVLDGSLPPGMTVSISDLSAQLGVSHIPVREALRRLDSEGLVELRRSRSAVVAPLDHDDFEAIFRLRHTLESDAVARAVKALAPDDLERLEAAYEALVIRPGDDAGTLSVRHDDFHRLLVSPAASRWDWRLLEIVWQANERYMFRILGELIEQGPTVFRETHAGLMEAARARSPRAARSAVAAHLKHGMQLIEPRLDDRAAEAPS